MVYVAAAENISVSKDYYIGLCLALSSTFFIGSSFVIKKKGLLKLSIKGQTRASVGGYGYLKERIWWAGLLFMGIGEAANFAAYAFAPASLVTPLGVLSVLVSAVLSSYFLGEKFNLMTKIGCFLCIIGSTIIVLHAPKEGTVDNMDLLQQLIFQPGFLTYVAITCTVSIIMIFYCVPRYGTTHVVVYILICSLVGSLSVMECKGLGLALRETFSGVKNEFSNWITWFLLIALVVCLVTQINYLNRALDIFDASVVTPVNYVFFTTFVILASAVLYKEWLHMDYKDIIGSLCGFLTVITGIFILNAFFEWDISISNISSSLQKKGDLESNLETSFQHGVETSHLFDCHRNDESSMLLERHSRQNSLESRNFATMKTASDSSFNSSSLSYT